MAKVLINDDWYEPIDPGTYYEQEFEKVLIQRSSAIFPEYFSVPFKKTVSSEYDSAKADYALIEKKYREWWIIEVELSNHSLSGHVLPQVETLVKAQYGSEEAEYLASKSDQLELNLLYNMMKGLTPRVLVVLDRPMPKWVNPLEKYDAKLAVFEILRSKHDRYIYRINGFIPSASPDVLSICRLDPNIPMLLTVCSPAVLEVDVSKPIEIFFNGRITVWSRIDISDRVWLKPEKRNPLNPKTKYRLLRNNDGSLRLEAATF